MNGEDARKWGRDRLICCLMLFNGGVPTTGVLWCGKFGWNREDGNGRGGLIHIMVLWVVTPYSVAHGYQNVQSSII